MARRASSVQHRNMKEYGPNNALQTDDGSSCWYSDGLSEKASSQQWYAIHFQRSVIPCTLKLQFQAGFSAETCRVEVRSNSGEKWESLIGEELEPEDVHDLQIFPLQSTNNISAGIDAIRLVFDEYTDFYGRVMLYKVEVWGKEVR